MKASSPLLFPLFSVLALVLLPGCASNGITNLTNTRYQANASDIYEFSFIAKPEHTPIEGTERGILTINGEEYEMRRSLEADDVFVYEYRMPPNFSKAKYFFTYEYDYENAAGLTSTYSIQSDLHTVELDREYVLQLDSARGPTGTRIHVIGKGFDKLDKVYFNGQPVQTEYVSPTSLVFTVPPMPANQPYFVSVVMGGKEKHAGEFFIDTGSIDAFPTKLNMTPGSVQNIVFKVNTPAPQGGLPLNITVDNADVVMIPEVAIPEGELTVSTPIHADQPGTGNIYVETTGYGQLMIPVTVE